jgi:hypothetical protein
MSVIKWRVYCITESAWSYGYLEEGIEPSKCFNNDSHTINENSYQEEEKISNMNVNVIEEIVPTGGNYKAMGYKFVNVAGENIHEYSYPYKITGLRISFCSSEQNRDDTMELSIAPNSTIGTITAGVSISDTVLTVSSDVLDEIMVGYYVNLMDNTNNDNLGVVVAVNKINSTITVKNGAVHAFSIGSLIKMTVKMVENYTFGYEGRMTLGDCKIGGSHLRKNCKVIVKYVNNKQTTVNFYPIIEFLY